MADAYHITVFDNFHRGDLDACWMSGTYSTADAAIASVKSTVDRQLRHFWSEACGRDGGRPTLDDLISRYNSFAETPVAFNSDGVSIFDTTAYMESRAAEMISEAAAQADRNNRETTTRSPSRARAHGHEQLVELCPPCRRWRGREPPARDRARAGSAASCRLFPRTSPW
ncbi:MAG TPA: hypothetical protein VKX28_02310 [Xanthobacteraceae bacterium]|nr:hypothetical protein [Xanthobacteraceae bacterium]